MEIQNYKKDVPAVLLQNKNIVPFHSIFEQLTKNLKEEDSNKSLREALIFATSIIGTIREPLVVLDASLRVISANKAYYNKFKEKKENIGSGNYIYKAAK